MALQAKAGERDGVGLARALIAQGLAELDDLRVLEAWGVR